MSITFVDEAFAHWKWEVPGVCAIATTASCGNLATHVGGDLRDVAEQRSRVTQLLPSSSVAVVSQVHGIDMHEIHVHDMASWELVHDPLVEADMLATSLPHMPLSIFTADCVPIVVASARSVVVAHAGWRGLAAGIIQHAMARLSDERELRALVGPCIGDCCYEVGVDVAHNFSDHARVVETGTRWHVDLGGAASAQLAEVGVMVDRIAVCTRCDSRLHSWRRDGTAAGRQAMIAWRVP
jgi:YfiH family protein